MPKSSIPSTHFHLIPTLVELEDAGASGASGFDSFVMSVGGISGISEISDDNIIDFRQLLPFASYGIPQRYDSLSIGFYIR